MVEKIQTTQKINQIFTYLFALFLGVIFYLFQLFPEYSKDFVSLKQKYNVEVGKNSAALKEVKAVAEKSAAYQNYKEVNAQKNIVKKQYYEARENEMFFGFKSLFFFLERLGLFLGFFIYACYNLFVALKNTDRFNLGVKILHGFIISVCMFYFFWIFQQFQDFSKITYYLATFISAAIVVLAIYFINTYKKNNIDKLIKANKKLQEQREKLIVHTILHTDEEKKNEILNYLEESLNGKG